MEIADNLYFENKADFPLIVSQLETINPDSIVFVASGIDTAGIVQHYGKKNKIPQLYGSSWVTATRVIKFNISIREYFQLLLFFSVILPLFVLGGIGLYIFSEILRKELSQYNNQQVSLIAGHVEQILENPSEILKLTPMI